MDISAAGRAFCDSDLLQAVMHVSLAFGCATRQQPAFTATEVVFAEWAYRRRVAYFVTVTYRPLCMFLWLIWRCHDR